MLGIFYYPWYGDSNNAENSWRHWEDNGKSPPTTWNSKYMPTLGLYDSQTTATVDAHMASIRAMGVDHVIWSWMGQDTFSDHSLSNWWTNGTNPTGLTHTIYYEKEWTEGPVSKTDVNSDIQYIKDNYAGSNTSPNTNWFRINGKAVIYVYNVTPIVYRTQTDYQEKLSLKWSEVRKQKAIYTVLKVFGGWQNYARRSDSWHQYGPSTSYAKIAGYSSFISPGFYYATDNNPRLARDLTRFETNIKSLKNDGTPLKTIQTWNEWTEGTSVESSTDWGNNYINIINKYF